MSDSKQNLEKAIEIVVKIRDEIEKSAQGVYALGGFNCPYCGFKPQEGFEQIDFILKVLLDARLDGRRGQEGDQEVA